MGSIDKLPINDCSEVTKKKDASVAKAIGTVIDTHAHFVHCPHPLLKLLSTTRIRKMTQTENLRSFSSMSFSFFFWLSETKYICRLFSDYRAKPEHRAAGPDTRSKQNTIRLEKVKKDDNPKEEVKKTEQEQKESDELEKRAKAKAEKKKKLTK